MPMTSRSTATLILTLAATAALSVAATAQTTDSFMQSQAAPIERANPATPVPATPAPAPADPQTGSTGSQPARPVPPAVKTSQPAPGVWLRVNAEGAVTTVSSTPQRTELRVDRGIANITVHHPAKDALILVDVGGGQLDLLKDGFYTVNAETKTARVLVGEADAYPNTDDTAAAKPIKVKEDHAITFGGASLRTVEFAPFQAGGDLLPRDAAYNHGDGRPAPYPAYGYGYGYGFYGGYPYYAWDYPYYGWGYPYGFGLGFGFGYYGGGYGRGFYGGGFRGRR